MAEVNENVDINNKHQDKHNTVAHRGRIGTSGFAGAHNGTHPLPPKYTKPYQLSYYKCLLNASREAPADRPPSGPGGQEPSQPPPIRPLNRTDSRSAFPPQAPRPGAPLPAQARPQFQPGGPVTAPQQFAPRPGTPAPRPQVPLGQPGVQQARPPPPQRPFGPQSIAPGPRPIQSPTLAQPPQRNPPPNNLQFGPRQPIAGVTTPDGVRPQVFQQPNGSIRGGAPVPGQLPRQPSQVFDSSNLTQNKGANLDNQIDNRNDQNINKPENGMEMPGMAKGRSYSIAAAPGAPSPLQMAEDRRKSVSAIGARVDDFSSRSPGLGLIQEAKLESKENIRGSKESIRSETSNDGRDIADRPDSRLSGSKMTESFMGYLSNLAPKKKLDDNDDVVLQNTSGLKIANDTSKNQAKDLSERSPSLTRSDESPEPKITTQSPMAPLKSQTPTPEPQRPKTPKIEQNQKMEYKPDQMNTRPITPKTPAKSPVQDMRAPMTPRKPNELDTTFNSKSTPRKVASAPKARPKDGDNDSGVDETTQGNDLNGSPSSPNKKLPSKLPTKEKSSSSLKQPNLSRSSSKSATAKTPENPQPIEKKKVPMNKVQVGNAPSPNIKAVRSKIGSLENATYKPGGGKVKIENRKLEFGNITPKIAAKNDAYTPSGGTKKITTTKLEWNVKSKVGSLQNTSYKPGGGDKKIETVKLDFKDKAKPKVASTVNITHKPGGGAVKIENQKLDFKAQSKIGSLDNVKHKPGGGDIKIFDDKDYIKQVVHSPLPDGSRGQSRQEDYYYKSMNEWEEEERPLTRCLSARAPRTPRNLSPRRRQPTIDEELVRRNNARNRRQSVARPASARDPPSSTCSRRASLTQRPAFTIY